MCAPGASRYVACRRRRRSDRRDAVRVHRALGRGEGLRRRPAHGRPVADDRVAAQVDVAAVATGCDGIEAMGYAANRSWVERDLNTYGGDAAGSSSDPSTPDCDSAEQLRAKVEPARDRGLRRVDFYHYGLMRLDALDWIHAALA